jgi:nucleoid DNA-binding protein
MAKKGALPLSERHIVAFVHERLQAPGEVGNGLSKAATKKVVTTLKEVIAESLAEGYKVTLPGFITITPVGKKGRKKGTEVHNPFDGTTKRLKKDEPDKFRIRARVSKSVLDAFPDTTKPDGEKLVKQLTPKKP